MDSNTVEASGRSSMVRSTDANSNLERTNNPMHIQLIRRVLLRQGNQGLTPSEPLVSLSLPESAKNLCSPAPTKKPKTDYDTCSDFKLTCPWALVIMSNFLRGLWLLDRTL